MKNNNWVKISILSISFLLMIRLTISSALADIGKAFPAVDQGQLMFMVALASMVAIPFGFFASFLSKWIKTKTLLYIALVLYLIGGIGPMFCTSFTAILILRGFLGAGIGFFLPFTAGLIAHFFEGAERNAMFGLQSTAVAVGNIITSILAGVLATISWQFAFLIYGFAFISLLLVIFKLPEPERTKKAEVQEKSLTGKMLYVCVSIFLYAIIYFSFFGYLSFVIDSNKLGNSATTGIAMMLMTLASIIMGLLFAKILKLLKRYAMFVAIMVNALGFFFLSIASSLVLIFIGAALIGLGFGFLMPLSTMQVTDSVPKSAATFANGMFMTFINVGTAISPPILVAVGNAFNNSDGQFIYKVCAAVLVAGAVLSAIRATMPEKAKEMATNKA